MLIGKKGQSPFECYKKSPFECYTTSRPIQVPQGRPKIARRPARDPAREEVRSLSEFIAGTTVLNFHQAPQGRKKSFQILLHIIHPVFLKERFEFFLERQFAMMLGLALDVFRRVLNAGDANLQRCTPSSSFTA